MRPAGLTAVCIICLVMGAMGGFSLVGGCVSLVAQPLILDVTQSFTKMLPGSNTPQFKQQMEQQRDLMQETMAIQRQWLPFMIVGTIVLGVAVVGLLVGAIKGLRLKRMAHRWMILGMVAAMVSALVSGYVDYGTQRATVPIAMRHATQTLQKTPGGASPAAKAMVSKTMQITMVLGLTFIIGWALAKCALYAVCIWYLLTPRIRQLFEGDGSDRAIIDALSEAPT